MGLPPARTTAGVRAGSSPAASAGVRSSATTIPSGSRSALHDAAEGPQDLVAHVPDVAGPGPHVLVGGDGEPALDVVERVGPGPGGVDAVVEARPGVREHVRVVEQQQLRVEDRGLGVADLAGRPVADPLQVLAHARPGLVEAAALLGRGAGVGRGHGHRGRTHRPDRADPDPG